MVYELQMVLITTVLNDNIEMFVRKDTNDVFVLKAVVDKNERDEYRASHFNYKDGDIFIDLGSHIGSWAIMMAKHNPTFKVYAYEPLPENFELINKNKNLNGLYNLTPIHIAVSCSTGKKEQIFYTRDDTPFGAQHKFVGSMRGDNEIYKNDVILEVPTISLNDILSGVPKVRVMKADCEGCIEKSIAYISPENMQKIDYVIGEFHPYGGMIIEQFYNYFKPYFEDHSEVIRVKGDLERFFYVNRRLKFDQ